MAQLKAVDRTRICDIEGCERRHEARGWCSLHYKRWRRLGDPEGKAQRQEVLVPSGPDDALRIELEPGVYTLVDREDAERLDGKKPYLGSNGYAYLTFWADGAARATTLHGWLMGIEPGKHIDHLDGDKLNNRRANLKHVSPQQNQVNRKRLNRNNTSGVRGVTKSRRGNWLAQITVNRKNHRLGEFKSIAEAAEARRLAEIKFYGEECPR